MERTRLSSWCHPLVVVLLLLCALLAPAVVARAHPLQSTVYTCRKYGYAFQAPAGWKPAKPDTRRCAVDPKSPLDTSSPQFSSPSGRAYVQIWAGPRASFDGKGWVTGWIALLNLPSTVRPSSFVLHGYSYFGIRASVLAKDNSGASFHLYLVLAATTHAANTVCFFGLVGLDHNSLASGEMRAVKQSVASLRFLA